MKHLFSSKCSFFYQDAFSAWGSVTNCWVAKNPGGWEKRSGRDARNFLEVCFLSFYRHDRGMFWEQGYKSYILYISVLDLLRWEARRRRWRLPRLWMEQNSSEGRLVDFLVTTTWWYNAVDWQRMGFAHEIFLAYAMYYAWMDTVIILTESSCCEGNERSLLHLSKFKVLAANNSSWHYFLTVVCNWALSLSLMFYKAWKLKLYQFCFKVHVAMSCKRRTVSCQKKIKNKEPKKWFWIYRTFTGAKRQTVNIKQPRTW